MSHPPSPNRPVRVATVTLSDTRSDVDDVSGRLLGERLAAAGHHVVSHQVMPDDPRQLRAIVLHTLCSLDVCEAVVTTGGTGIAPRDRTIEALSPLFQQTIDGFGEAFRRLSWEEVGPRAVLSRAVAGVVRGRLVVALPGSPRAVRLAVDKLLGPILAHAVDLASGRRTRHA